MLCHPLQARNAYMLNLVRGVQASLRKLVAEIAHEDEEVQHLVQAHNKLMRQKPGQLPSYKDVLSTLHDFGFDLTEREGLQLIEQLDLDKSGSIDLHEWLAALMNWSKVRPTIEVLKPPFLP